MGEGTRRILERRIGGGRIMAATPLRSFRINDDLYAQAQARAEVLGLTVTDVIVGAMEMFVDGTIDPELLGAK